MYILHVAAFRCILVGGLLVNVYISHYFKYIGTLKTDGGGGQHSNLFRTKEKAGDKRGWRLSGVLLYLLLVMVHIYSENRLLNIFRTKFESLFPSLIYIFI